MLISFFDTFFSVLDRFDDFTWSYIAVPAILFFGIYFSCKARWFQITHFKKITELFFNFLTPKKSKTKRGIPPLNAFFASIGGCIGIGNIVGVCTAVQIGGPGAIFWMWIAALLGMVVKYSEIYLGVKYRVDATGNRYNGGPMYYLKKVDSTGLLSTLFCLAMCVYGVEIYMFRIVTHSIVTGWGWNPYVVITGLLAAILLCGKHGIETVGKVSSVLIPIFLVAFIGVCGWVFATNIPLLLQGFGTIFKSAFTGHAAIGAFTGSTMMLAVTNGMKRACYTGDIGIGYASIIHAESEEATPERQAALGVFGIFLDTFVVCTCTVLLILITGLWSKGIHEDLVLATALGKYIPYMNLVWPFFVFLLGFSSLIAFYAVGTKSAEFLWPRHGRTGYKIYAIASFILFSFVGTEAHIMTVMSSVGAILLLINMYGMLRLRNHISFSLRNID
jgi:AGCS family alanine or glycine:cation symporter